MNWSDWTLDRILILFVSLAFLFLAIQVTMFHYRQNFHMRAMWIPVLAAPLFFLVGFILVFYSPPWMVTLFHLLMWLGVVDGLIGLYYHFRGVGIRVGGWKWRNFLIGPPVVMPLMFMAVSSLGVIAILWR